MNTFSSDESSDSDFRQELSQLIHRHMDQDISCAEMVSALEMQAELVRTRSETVTRDPTTEPASHDYEW